MIKRIITTTLAVLLVVLVAIAAPGRKGKQTARVHISKDSISISAAEDSTAGGLVFTVTGNADSRASEIVEVDGTDYLLYGGNAFKVETFKKLTPDRIAHKVKADMHDEIMAYHDSSAWNDNIVALMSIIFIVPCVTIIILAVLLIGFLTNKNRSRNSLISKAIDNNYPLPDSFYGLQSAPSCDFHQPDGAPSTDSGTRMVSPAQRDPRKYSSAVALIAIGVALTLFLWAVGSGAPSFFGLIPLLLGVGQLVGYYYVPGFTTENLNSSRRYPNYGYDPYAGRPNGRQGGYNPSQPCPPPPPSSSYTNPQNSDKR